MHAGKRISRDSKVKVMFRVESAASNRNKGARLIAIPMDTLYESAVWPNVGTMFFRGTITDMESTVFSVEVWDMEERNSKRSIVSAGKVSLKGVCARVCVRS
eukprot:GHVU01069194.1.p6 GENE.GHVU01069194.1~~GHVU01069194.1.p6  ORF type:complete len:102 (-),score=6.77 GHVU01069194.1:1932-2237(-)